MEKPGYKIAILGAGNVAWHLAPALEAAGHTVICVYSRTLNHAQALAEKLPSARATSSLDFTKEPVDIFLLAVKDAALSELLSEARFPENSLVVHTSGTQPLSVFEKNPGIRGGVFYPLQTFSKQTPVNFKDIPFCLECDDENGMLLLQKTAQSLSKQVSEVSSEQRKVLHLAAVFASNFTNHLLGISHQIMQAGELDFNLLKPLVEQTIAKAFSQEPFSVQTGPAVRFDENTIQTQLKALEGQGTYQKIYELLSRSIQDQAKKL